MAARTSHGQQGGKLGHSEARRGRTGTMLAIHVRSLAALGCPWCASAQLLALLLVLQGSIHIEHFDVWPSTAGMRCNSRIFWAAPSIDI